MLRALPQHAQAEIPGILASFLLMIWKGAWFSLGLEVDLPCILPAHRTPSHLWDHVKHQKVVRIPLCSP